MTSLSSVDAAPIESHSLKPHLDQPMDMRAILIFLAIMAGGLFFAAYSIYGDMQAAGDKTTALPVFLLLGVALLIALGFEFVNGFHDTANAVATVIYTHSLPAHLAVIWSGFFNFLGVATSSGLVAFGIVSLLPVELILQVGSSAGFAMVFAMLISAIIWNLSTWWFGLPASSSHTMIGSIIGVGIVNAMMRGRDGTSGIDGGKAAEIGYALLLSPVFGFACAAGLLLIMKHLVKKPELYTAPQGQKVPPWWIRGLLIATCTGVSFFHGSNDGQKGMGLIMLILIGTVPTAYALNRTMPASQTAHFIVLSDAASKVFDAKSAGPTVNSIDAAKGFIGHDIAEHNFSDRTYPSLALLVREIAKRVSEYGSLDKVPADKAENTRNLMYLTSEAIRFLGKTEEAQLTADETKILGDYKKGLDEGTKFIPFWVKICVALALGLGTMIGWKRIVVTVGEKIGKEHLTYGQGAAAELVAASVIAVADYGGLPVSTTHVLSSGIAGTMAANGSGIQLGTLRNIALAWILTLPCAIALSGFLYFVFAHIF
jgi:inorganic phosphate transporter, PiT family